MKRVAIAGLMATCLLAQSALAQDNNDFMTGRLFQIALESMPEFTPGETVSFGTLAEGATQTFEQTLVAGTCYTWLAVGDTGQADLNLTVTVGGVPVAADSALDDWPITQYCSAAAVEARIDLLMHSGAGAYAFNTYSKFFGGADQIELNLNFYSSIFAPGSTPEGPATRVTLATGAEETFPVPLTGGACYTIIGVSGPGVVDIDMFLTDITGQIVDADEATDNFPVVGVCPISNGNFNLRVGMYSGAGEMGWQVFRISH